MAIFINALEIHLLRKKEKKILFLIIFLFLKINIYLYFKKSYIDKINN